MAEVLFKTTLDAINVVRPTWLTFRRQSMADCWAKRVVAQHNESVGRKFPDSPIYFDAGPTNRALFFDQLEETFGGLFSRSRSIDWR